MARGLRLWLVVVVAGSLATFAGLTAWFDSVARSYPGVSRDSLQLVHDSLIRHAGQTATAIQRIRWSRAVGDADTLLVLGPHLPVRESFIRRVAEARTRLDPDARVDVAVALTTRRWQRPEDGSRYGSYIESHGTDYLLPGGGPCQVVMFVPGGATTPSALDTYFPTDYLLGPCAFVARYGPPSDSVRAWIQWGGGRFARTLEPSTPLAERAAEAGSRLARACLAGNVEACALALDPAGTPLRMPGSFDDADAPHGLVLYDHDLYAGDPFGSVGAHLLADIEAEIGRDRFAAFWRTDAPVDAALADALGRPLGEWVADWAAARLPAPDRAGLRLTDVLFSLLAVALFLGIGLLVGAKGRPIRASPEP
jgi:hypothetical protein